MRSYELYLLAIFFAILSRGELLPYALLTSLICASAGLFVSFRSFTRREARRQAGVLGQGPNGDRS